MLAPRLMSDVLRIMSAVTPRFLRLSNIIKALKNA